VSATIAIGTGVTQTILHGQGRRPGNCLSACVATYLGRDLRDVPHFIEVGSALYANEVGSGEDRVAWWAMLVGFMAAVGLAPVQLVSPDDAEPGEVVFAAGPSERGVFHQTLYRDGTLLHDPHPSRAGLVEVREVLAWRPTTHDHDPAAPGPHTSA
jgi:hypothetical protein